MVCYPKQHHPQTRFSTQTDFCWASNKLKSLHRSQVQTLSICTSCGKTYRCLVDVVHDGGSSAACPDGVLAQRKEVLSSSGQDTGPILGGFYSQSLALSGPSPGGPAFPLFVPRHVSTNVCLCMCVILANLSQSPGSDINAAALRGHTLEWNELRGAWWSLISREGAIETLNIPLDLGQRRKGLRRFVCVCVCGYVSVGQGVVEEVRGWRMGDTQPSAAAGHEGSREKEGRTVESEQRKVWVCNNCGSERYVHVCMCNIDFFHGRHLGSSS